MSSSESLGQLLLQLRELSGAPEKDEALLEKLSKWWRKGAVKQYQNVTTTNEVYYWPKGTGFGSGV